MRVVASVDFVNGEFTLTSITGDIGNATQTNIEAYFGLLVNDRINFSPSILYVINPDNQLAKSVWQWGLRMSFEF